MLPKTGRTALAILVCALMIISIPLDVVAAPFSGKVVREKVESKTNTLGEAKVELFNFADIQTTGSSPVTQSGGLKYTDRHLSLPSKAIQAPMNATEPTPLWNLNDSAPGAKPAGALTNVQSQVKNGQMFNTPSWTGGLEPVPQTLGGTAKPWDQGLNIDMVGNVNNTTIITTGPAGTIPSVQTRANDTAPSLEEFAGTATINPQLKNAAMTLVHPTGAETIQPLISDGKTSLVKPIGTVDNAILGMPAIMTNVAPAGAHLINPQIVNLSANNTRPTGVPLSQSGIYYVGNISIDANQSGMADSILYICLVDELVSGNYVTTDLSINDEVFGEGLLGDGIVDWGAGGNTNDEDFAAGTFDIRLGNANAPIYTFSRDNDPTLDDDDARIQSKEWYTGNFLIDGDGGLVVDDTVYFSVYDEDSNGVFDAVDLSMGDQTFGEGNLTNSSLLVGDDETLNGTGPSGGLYGPDDGGYTWTDKAVYDWIEINSTGTNQSLGDDDYIDTIELGFDFQYYGDTFNNTTICSNGWITFNDSIDNTFSWYPSDVPSEGDGYYGPICVICDDIDLSSSGALYYGTYGSAPNRYFVVEFWMVEQFGGGNARTAEIILYESSNIIKMQWKTSTVVPDAVGIERNNETAGIGNAASGDLWVNTTNMTDGTAIMFFPPGGVSRTDLRIGDYMYRVLRSASPSTSAFDLNITNTEWFIGLLPFDTTESGKANDRLNYAIADTDSNGIYDKLDLSLNFTFGYGDLGNDVVNSTEGERYNWLAAPTTITIGPNLPFTIEFDRDPGADANDLRIVAMNYYTGSFVVDSDADGAVDDTYYFVLTDSNSDGAYESVDISYNDQTFGQGGTLTNGIAVTGDDERYLWNGNIRLGSDIYFTIISLGAPTAGNNDLSVVNKWTYKGNMSFDADLDGKQDEDLFFLISDTNSDGIYDAVDLSFDAIFGEGNLGDGLVTAKPFNDEQITANADIQLSLGLNFAIDFDSDPMTDTSDLRITVKVWFKGTFLVDANNDGSATEQLYYFLSDTDSDGFMEVMDLSLGNEVFGEGNLGDGIVASGNDERITKETSLSIGALKFMANFTGSPMGQFKDGVLKNLDMFEGQFNVDLGKTGLGTDVVYFIISDPDADGVYDTIDLSLGDEVFRQDLTTDTYVDENQNDEKMTASGDVRVGPFTYSLDFVTDPFQASTVVTLKSKQWYLGSFVLDADGDGVANETLHFLISDLNSNGVYDTMDLSMDDTDFGQGTLNDQTLAVGNDEQITGTSELDIGVQHMEARFTASPNQNIEDAWLANIVWYTGVFEGAGWTIYFTVNDKTSDGVYDTMELSTNALFGEGDVADDYVTASNDEIVSNGDMVLRGTYHYRVLINGTMGGSQDAGLKSIEWRLGRWTIEGLSRSAAVSDSDSDGVFDTIHLDMNDDGIYDGSSDITGGMAGFRGNLIMSYAVASSNDDGTQIEVTPMNATVVSTVGWKVGYLTVDGINIGLALCDRDGDGIYDTMDLDTNGDGIIDMKGLSETGALTATINGKGHRVLRIAPDGTYAKIVAFTDAILGPAMDRSISGVMAFGKVSETAVGLDLNQNGNTTESLVALVIDVSSTGPSVERTIVYLDLDLDADLTEEEPLMLGSVFEMGNANWKVDSISSDRKQVGLMKISAPAATVTTGPDGVFSLSPPDGTYWLRFSSSQTGWGYKLLEDTNNHRGYKVAGAGITDKEVVLSPVATSISGTVTDMISGEPLSGVSVTVYNTETKKVVSTLTLTDGTYLLGVLRNSVYSVSFSKTGYQTDDGTKLAGTWHGLAVGAGRNDIDVALMPDPAPDILSFLEPAEGSIVSGTVSVRVKATDLVKVDGVGLTTNDGITWLTMNSQGNNEFLLSWNTKEGPDGTYKVTARAMNDAGLKVDKVLILKVDNGGPLVVFKTAPEQYGNVEISVKATDEFSEVKSMEVRIDGGAWQKMSKSGDGWYYLWSSGPFDSGTHNYEVKATDSRGNSAIYKSKVKVDNTWMLLMIVMVVMLVVLVVVFLMKKKKMAAVKAPPAAETSSAPKEVPK